MTNAILRNSISPPFPVAMYDPYAQGLINSFSISDGRLLKLTFVNGFDPDQARQNVGPDH